MNMICIISCKLSHLSVCLEFCTSWVCIRKPIIDLDDFGGAAFIFLFVGSQTRSTLILPLMPILCAKRGLDALCKIHPGILTACWEGLSQAQAFPKDVYRQGFRQVSYRTLYLIKWRLF